MFYRTVKPILVDAIRTEEAVTLPTAHGNVHAEAGEWLVRNADGSIFVVSHERFQNTFEKMDGDLYAETEGRPCGC